MRSRAYWIARAAALEAALQNAAAAVTAETVKAYERAIEAINADIRDTFSAYAANDIPDGEAEKLLNAAESDKTYAELMQVYAETTDVERRADILARVNAQAYGARISRLEGVKSRILIEMTRAANAAVTAHKTLYTRTLQKSYYTTVYNIAEGLNCGVDFSFLPARAINAALQEPWNGANYSDRVWNHNDRFTEAVQNTVTTGIMAGHSVNRMAAQLDEYARSESADGVLYSTTRLVRTETAHFMNTGQKAAYDEIGIKKYRFVAALSERTCETCGALDGQVFDVAEAREGVNYPPIHPNCRCTTVMADAISKTRIARDPETGRNYKVDGDMTFEEWKASLTDEQRAAMETHVRQMRNKSADKAQFEKYSAIYGKEFPKNLESFQEMKYYNISDWNVFKRDKQEKLNQMKFEDMGGLVGKLGNKEVRLWYKAQDEKIPRLLDSSQPLEQQARHAYGLRNEHRTQARELMRDQEYRRRLDREQPNKPFEYFYNKYKTAEKTDDEVYKIIINKSTQTNKAFDRKAGVDK